MNKSSQFSTFKNNFVQDKRISFNKTPNIEKELRMSNQIGNIKRNFSLKETKSNYKSLTLNLNKKNQKENSLKHQIEIEKENKVKFMGGKYRISEQTLENDLKQTNENLSNEKNNNDKEKKNSFTSNEIVVCETKIIKNNLQKFNMTKTKYSSTCNFKPYIDFTNKSDINKNYINYFSQMNLSNPKIKIKISHNVTEKIKNSSEYLTNKKGNVLYNSYSENLGKNTNLYINNNITNFYSMANLTAGFEDKVKIKKNHSEEEIQKKLAIYRIKLNSEMLRILNEEKTKENDRQVFYENLKNGEEKKNYEKEVTKDRLDSSDKIVRMNK